MPEELRQEVSEQNRIRLEKLRALQAEGRDPYRITCYDQTHHSKEILENFEALDGQTVSIAGRMMSRRVMGKASFAHVLDRDGQIQIYVRRDDVGEEAYSSSRTSTSATSSALRASFSARRWARSASTRRRSRCSPSACIPCRRSSTASRTWTHATASATST